MTKFYFSLMGAILILYGVIFFKNVSHNGNPPPYDISPDDGLDLKKCHYALFVLSFVVLYVVSGLFL